MAAASKKGAKQSDDGSSGKVSADTSADSSPVEIPCLKYLGCGYDVFGKYADCDSVILRRILDIPFNENSAANNFEIENVKFSYPPCVEVYRNPKSIYAPNQIQQTSQIAKSLNEGTQIGGNIPYFGGTLTVNFATSLTNSESNSLTRNMESRVLYVLKISDPELKKLTKRAEEDITGMEENGGYKMTPEQVFDKYGTHVLTSFKVGGAFAYIDVSGSKEAKQSTEIGVDIKSTISVPQASNSSVSVEGNRKTGSSEEESMKSENGLFVTKGGNALFASDPSSLDDWGKNLVNSPTICDFVDKDSLMPIWTWAGKRANEFERAFCTYKVVKQQQLARAGVAPYLRGQIVRVDKLLCTDEGDEVPSDFGVGIPQTDPWSDDKSDRKWFILGQTAFQLDRATMYLPRDRFTLLVQELIPGSLVKVKWNTNPIWQWKPPKIDAKFYSLWKGEPDCDNPYDYVVLGDYFKVGDEWPPSKEETKFFRAVLREAVKEHFIYPQKGIWDNHRSISHGKVSIWPVPLMSNYKLELRSNPELPMGGWSDDDLTLKSGLFITSDSFEPPIRKTYCFKRNALQLL